jgi:hypothetical protein
MERGCEAIGEVLVAEQPEDERCVRSIQELDPARRLGRVDLIEAELAVEDVERAVGLFARPACEMRGTVDEDPRPVQRIADALVTIEVRLGHGSNTTR